MAAATAEAPPSKMPLENSKKFPTPPHAITGILILFVTIFINAISYPVPLPSLSIEFNNISPAPNASHFLAQSNGSKPVSLVPELL